MTSAVAIQKWQRKILILCWCGYAGAYLCRTNISIALPGMMDSLGWNKTDAGLMGTMFFWAYAIGQLINGFIGDKVKTRPFIFIGLCTSAAINFFVGFSSNLVVTGLLWCINGFFLSTLWGPIVKTISLWFPKEKRTRVAVIMSVSMIGGYLFAWGIIGQVIVRVSWRWAFWIPAAVVFAYSLVWLLKMRNRPEEVGLESSSSCDHGGSVGYGEGMSKTSFSRMVLETRLWLVALTCIAQGVVKDGISLWAPTFLSDTQNLSQERVALFSLAIPMMSLIGIFGAGWLIKIFRSNEIKAIAILISGAAFTSLLLYFFLGAGAYFTVLLLSATVALMYGANTILLTIIPLNFEKYNRVSAVAGFLDFFSYMGAAAAGVVTGVIIDHLGWEYVILCWVVLAVLGIVCILSVKSTNKNKQQEAYTV